MTAEAGGADAQARLATYTQGQEPPLVPQEGLGSSPTWEREAACAAAAGFSPELALRGLRA